MSFTPTSSIRPVGAGAKLVAALKEAHEQYPNDPERQALYVRQQMTQAPKAKEQE